MTRALISIGVLQFLTLIAGVLRAKGLSLALGVEGVGITSTIDQIVLMVTQLGAVGIPFTALKYMSRAHSESAEDFVRVSTTFLRLIAILALAITLLSLATVLAFPASVGAEMSGYIPPILIALLSVAPLMATAVLVNIFASAQMSGAAAAMAFVSVGAQAVAAVVGAFLGGVLGVYVATAATGLVVTAGALAVAQSKTGVSLLGRGASLAAMIRQDKTIPTTAIAVYFSMISYAGALLAVRYGVLAQSGEAAAGLLHAALTIALTVGSILAAMSGLYLAPALNRASSNEEKIRVAHDFCGRILALFLLGALPIALFPGLVVSLLFTASFLAAAPFVAGFLTWQCLYQVMNVYQQLLVGLNSLRYMAFSGALGLIAAAVLSVVMIERAGPNVVALALIGGAIISGGLMLARLTLKFGMSIPIPLVLRSVIVVAAIAIAHSLFLPSSELQIAGFIARTAFAIAVFAVLFVQLTPPERAIFDKGVNLVLSRLKLRPKQRPQQT